MSNHRQGNARPKFALGRIYATHGALKLLERWQQGAYQFLARHERGDWGLVHPDDAVANEYAIGQGLRIISSYMVSAAGSEREQDVLWIITEADRSATTLLLRGNTEMPRHTLSVTQYLRNALAANTLKAYARDLERFKASGGHIPARPEQVARYLAAAAADLKPSTLARQAAAISYAHEQRGLASPTTSAIVRRTLQGIRRAKGVAQKRAAPLTPTLVAQLVRPLCCLSEVQNRRDAALFLVAFAGGFRRSEIASLRVSDISISRQGVLIKLTRSKTDQYQRGREVAIPKARDSQQCPVRALRRWARMKLNTGANPVSDP